MGRVAGEIGRQADESGLICLALILKFLQVAADPAQLRHLLGNGEAAITSADLVRLAKKLGAKSKLITLKTIDDLAEHPLPAICRWRDGGYFVLAKVSGGHILIQDPQQEKPLTLSLEEL